MWYDSTELRLNAEDDFVSSLERRLPGSSYKTFRLECHSSYTSGDYERLCAVFKSNHSLESIDIGSCNCYSGVLAISEALKTNTTVESVTFWINFFGVEGAKKISEMLKVNTTLRDLDIHSR